jgi:hypothetical protein
LADLWRATRILPVIERKSLPDKIALSRIVKGKDEGVCDRNEEVYEGKCGIDSNQIS